MNQEAWNTFLAVVGTIAGVLALLPLSSFFEGAARSRKALRTSALETSEAQRSDDPLVIAAANLERQAIVTKLARKQYPRTVGPGILVAGVFMLLIALRGDLWPFLELGILYIGTGIFIGVHLSRERKRMIQRHTLPSTLLPAATQRAQTVHRRAANIAEDRKLAARTKRATQSRIRRQRRKNRRRNHSQIRRDAERSLARAEDPPGA